jgi:hypothetical protein
MDEGVCEFTKHTSPFGFRLHEGGSSLCRLTLLGSGGRAAPRGVNEGRRATQQRATPATSDTSNERHMDGGDGEQTTLKRWERSVGPGPDETWNGRAEGDGCGGGGCGGGSPVPMDGEGGGERGLEPAAPTAADAVAAPRAATLAETKAKWWERSVLALRGNKKRSRGEGSTPAPADADDDDAGGATRRAEEPGRAFDAQQQPLAGTRPGAVAVRGPGYRGDEERFRPPLSPRAAVRLPGRGSWTSFGDDSATLC